MKISLMPKLPSYTVSNGGLVSFWLVSHIGLFKPNLIAALHGWLISLKFSAKTDPNQITPTSVLDNSGSWRLLPDEPSDGIELFQPKTTRIAQPRPN